MIAKKKKMTRQSAVDGVSDGESDKQAVYNFHSQRATGTSERSRESDDARAVRKEKRLTCRPAGGNTTHCEPRSASP